MVKAKKRELVDKIIESSVAFWNFLRTGSRPLRDSNVAMPTQPRLRFAGPDGAKLVFYGPPSGVRGRIPLHNPTEERQRLRSLAVSATDLLGPAQLPLREFPIAVGLRPGEQASVPATIRLDLRTEPGPHELKLNVGGRDVAATVYVSEVVNLRIQPDEVTIVAGARHTYTRQFMVQNLSNITLSLGARCETPLFQSVDYGATILEGLAKASKKELIERVAAALENLGDTVAGTLVVTREAVTLAPGQMATGPVEFTLPPDLKPLHQYYAVLGLYGTTLRLNAYATAKSGREKDKAGERQGKRR